MMGEREAEDPFEAEEILSLSDLPITAGDSVQCDYSYSKEDDGDDDFFEFISEDFTASTMGRDVVFCGRIINIESSKDATERNTNQNDKDSSALIPLILNKHASRPSISRDSTLQKVRELKDSKYNRSRQGVSLMRSATKRRWYLFMFRMPSVRLPAEMDLSDIRNRQRRRSVPAASTKLPEPAGGEEIVSKSNKGRRIWWSGKMLRSFWLGFGCGGSNASKQANDVVKSFMPMM